ncbi:PAAR domain-containing protein [Vibrio diabolicus]|uniref:PAAR domain-containing protein n=1 Tax=Vibrio diabolicus TaxID=50719 RepID=UPI00215C2E12|nr:PAAR domain-containing protein [Vibrio diabolicus]MCR9306489.1 PAAR domain-containing protein [Vibrio diabolicus]
MPAVGVVGSVDSGHGGFSPGVFVTGRPLLTVNGINVLGTGDISVMHVKPDNPPHVGVITGSSKLTVNGVPVAVVGDALGCGATLVNGNDLLTID